MFGADPNIPLELSVKSCLTADVVDYSDDFHNLFSIPIIVEVVMEAFDDTDDEANESFFNNAFNKALKRKQPNSVQRHQLTVAAIERIRRKLFEDDD